jgi:hypothetical protein
VDTTKIGREMQYKIKNRGYYSSGGWIYVKTFKE